MQIVFISGPYRAKTVFGRIWNIFKARRVALKYWSLGYAVICPHSNTAFFDGKCPDDLWLKGCFEFIKCATYIVMTADWKKSPGAQEEYNYANKLNKCIIFD